MDKDINWIKRSDTSNNGTRTQIWRKRKLMIVMSGPTDSSRSTLNCAVTLMKTDRPDGADTTIFSERSTASDEVFKLMTLN